MQINAFDPATAIFSPPLTPPHPCRVLREGGDQEKSSDFERSSALNHYKKNALPQLVEKVPFESSYIYDKSGIDYRHY
jgi:hypothetical protein